VPPPPAQIPTGSTTPAGPPSPGPTASNPSSSSPAANPPSREVESSSTTTSAPQGTQVSIPNEPRAEQPTQSRVEIPSPPSQELPRATSQGELPGRTNGRAPPAAPNMGFMLSSMLRMRDDYRSMSSQLFSIQGASPADTARLSALQESFDRLDRESGRMLDNLRQAAFAA
jgi:hypothetical protein